MTLQNPIEPTVVTCQVGDVTAGAGQLVLIAGPCVLENSALALEIARHLCDVCQRLEIPLVFKGSFDKANRTSVQSYRGVGLSRGLEILDQVRRELAIPVTTDIHEPAQAAATAEVCELLQIPAFLARQTDLLVAAGQTGRAVNVKKGQFMARPGHAIRREQAARRRVPEHSADRAGYVLWLWPTRQ